MVQTEIRLRIPNPRGTTELEVISHRAFDPTEATQRGLASVGVHPWCSYVVRTEHRVIAHARLTERDGTALSRQRVQEVLRALKSSLRA